MRYDTSWYYYSTFIHVANYYFPSSNLLFCGYSVIYGIISNLWGNYEKIEDEYLMSVYIQRIPYKRRATFSDKYSWPNFTRFIGLYVSQG
jgi:hypothetical protein